MPPLPQPDDYGRFLARLRARERYEPAPRGRGPEKLAGMRLLLERLGHPERACRVVHVAGTNGKGMTSAMVALLLQRAGRRVGCYASPHLLDIRERIVLDGEWIARDAFAETGTAVLDTAEELPAHLYLSYFDLLTAMGLLAFQHAGMEWAVLEVGLGGASDATNTTEKELCILTRLGLDHMAVLGESEREIAEQKLGILRPGVPTVVAPQRPALRPWLEERIAALGSEAVFVESLVASPPQETDGQMRVRAPWPDGGEVACAPTRVTGPRLECAAIALAAASRLLGQEARAEWLRAVLELELPGRLDLRRDVAVTGLEGAAFPVAVLDGGHNAGALEALNAQLRAWDVKGYTLIFGMQRDKMVAAVRPALRTLCGGAGRIVILLPQTPRSPAPAELEAFLAEVLAGSGPLPPVEHGTDARDALRLAARPPAAPLVVAGSFWMLGDLMAALHLQGGAPPSP